MSKNSTLLLEDSMEKKLYAPKGCLMQIDGSSRQRQDVPGSGTGNQALAVPYSKSKPHRRQRRDGPAAQTVINFKPESSSQKNQSSKGNRKGKTTSVLQQVDDKDSDGGNQPAEVGSLQLPGSKKQNLVHLLNFHFTPRESQGRPAGHLFHHPARPIARSKQLHHDSFVQANCQFVVSDDEVQYHVDLPINWKSVEQIIIRTYGGTPSCPICLCSPSAAKITKCGHVFCWSCILRYFSYGDGRHSQPCPICFHLINALELKSVVANLVDEVHVGDSVKMQLMCRKKDCSDSCSVPVNSKMDGCVVDKQFQKLLRLTPQQVQSEVLDREHTELIMQLDCTMESLETEFVLAAITELETRRKNWMDKVGGSIDKEDEIPTGEMCGGTGLSLDEANVLGATSIDISKAEPAPANEVPINWDEYAYFYQAADGSNTFMSPLNMAMLWKHFGPDPALWPYTVALRVVEIELLNVTAELRKRFKFLQHVPLNSSIQLLEVDLKGTVTKDVLVEFSNQLNERKRRRSERARAERRRERLQQEAERLAHLEPDKPKIESLSDFPNYRTAEEEAQALEHAIQASLGYSDYDKGKESARRSDSSAGSSFSSEFLMFSDAPPRRAYPPLEIPKRPSLSFAQALNTRSQSKPPIAPVSKSKSPLESSVSGKTMSSERESEQEESEILGFRTRFSDAIASAVANFNLNEIAAATAGDSSEQSSSARKKKGRKKGKVLFATAMGMGNN